MYGESHGIPIFDTFILFVSIFDIRTYSAYNKTRSQLAYNSTWNEILNKKEKYKHEI